MDERDFRDKAIRAVVTYFNNLRDVTDSKPLSTDMVYIVWQCKVLQNNQALLSTTVSDGMYYEYTYNGAQNEAYLDAYKKIYNTCIFNP